MGRRKRPSVGVSSGCRITPPANPTTVFVPLSPPVPFPSAPFPFRYSRSFSYSSLPFVIPALLRHSGESRNPEDHLKRPFVSIPASRRNGTLSIGVTSNLDRRMEQHGEDAVAGFTRRYGVHTLVWYEGDAMMESVIERKKALKRWRRAWKVESIEKRNPL